MIELVWHRLRKHKEETFRQIRGGEFTYTIKGNTIDLSRISHSVSMATF